MPPLVSDVLRLMGIAVSHFGFWSISRSMEIRYMRVEYEIVSGSGRLRRVPRTRRFRLRVVGKRSGRVGARNNLPSVLIPGTAPVR